MVKLQQSHKKSFFQKFQERLESLPVPKTEESVLLRIFVQALVIVGIIATDVAGETWLSLWAVPLSIVGAIWSWHNRKKPNITAKFLIAIGMISMMLLFFGDLFRSLNDTRLVLAKLLIELQVLHSFDLPRRKDLGYSTLIGIILLGVAGTVSQTLAFAPFLLLFLGLVFPVLILDYRSRLGLKPLDQLLLNPPNQDSKNQSFKLLQYFPIAPRKLARLFGIVLILGLFIFAIMPRFPGYQLQNFPVSSGIEQIDEKEQTFNENNQGISNPGYVKEGEQGTGGQNQGNSPTSGQGEMDETFYYGFNRTMNMNLRGEMEKKLVLRVRSQNPGFWRVLAFDRYNGQGWESSRPDDLKTINRPNWTYRFNIYPPFIKGGTKRIIQSYTVASDLPNIIPALTHPSALFFPTKEIALDPEGSLISPTFMTEGLTYTVISDVPYRNRTLLRTASTKYPQEFEKYYLQIPEEIKAKVKQKAEELMAKSTYDLTSNYEKALFLTQALKQQYRIIPEIPFFDENEDLVTAFLDKYQGGYPDHFSAVLTIMLRSIGIPARLTVGFAPGQFNPFTGYYLVHNTDAYAITEVYFGSYGWFAFDPIPGHDLFPPSIEEYTPFGIVKQFWDWIASWLPSPLTGFLKNIWDFIIVKLITLISKLWQFFSSGIVGFLTVIIVFLLLSLISFLGFNQVKKWLKKIGLSKLSPEAKLYQEMIDFLAEKGYPKYAAQTPLEYAQSCFNIYEKEQAEIILKIAQAYVSWHYGDQPQNVEYLQGQFNLLKRSFQRIKI